MTLDKKMALDTGQANQITQSAILEIIERVEAKRKVVWTAGRVLMEDGSEKRIATQRSEIRKPYFKRIRTILKDMATEGTLNNRGIQFNYGTGREVAYDYIDPAQRLPKMKRSNKAEEPTPNPPSDQIGS